MKMDEYVCSTQTPVDLCKEIDELRVKVQHLENELKHEKELNNLIKVRFVECNTCTPDKKDKCLMWSENLCEGERCNELVDLDALINKSDKEN